MDKNLIHVDAHVYVSQELPSCLPLALRVLKLCLGIKHYWHLEGLDAQDHVVEELYLGVEILLVKLLPLVVA